MHTAIRPYATAGVALVGASVIAVSPLAPPLPDVHIPSVHVSAVELTQFVSPITTLLGVITDTVTNTVGLAQRVAEFPIAKVVIANQLAYLTALATSAQTTVSGLVTWVQGIPAALQSAASSLAMGDVAGAINGLATYFTLDLAFSLAPLLEGVSSVGSAVFGNIGAAGQALFSLGSVLNLGLAVVYPILGFTQAFADTAQALFTAVTTGDFVTAASVLINAPIVLTGAFLNGDPTGMTTTSGLLTTDFGTFANLLNVRDIVAAAIVPFTDPGGVVKPKTPAPSGTALAQANQVPASVTSNAAARTDPPAGGSDTTNAPTVGSGPVAKLLTPPNQTANGNKVTPDTASAKGTKAGGGLASALSKIGGGLTSKKTSK